MREILFRAKHIHATKENEHLNGQWMYGYLSDEDVINSPELKGEFLIDPETVCQYIGLTDKNGNKIWENDIVEIPAEDGYFLVNWNVTEARWEMDNKADLLIVDFDDYWANEVEVVGNAFDNTGLLN